VFGEGYWEADYTCVCPANIDLILDNIFREKEQLTVIDGEWVFDFPIPAEFIIWRTINELYTHAAWFEEQFPRKEFLKEYGIEEADERRFWKWATYFEKEYVKANGLADYAVPEVGVSLEEIRNRRIREEYVDSTLYLDTGCGYSEKETIRVRTKVTDGQYKATFVLPKDVNITSLRFDPLEGNPSICRLGSNFGKLVPANGTEEREEGMLFLTTDPVYRVEFSGKLPESLTIKGRVERKEKEWAIREYEKRQSRQQSRFKFWK
jgi:hypothetical protein